MSKKYFESKLDEYLRNWQHSRPTLPRWQQTRTGFEHSVSDSSGFEETARYIMHFTDPGDVVLDARCAAGNLGISAYLCGDRGFLSHMEYTVDAHGTIARDVVHVENIDLQTFLDEHDDESAKNLILDDFMKQLEQKKLAEVRNLEPFSYIGERHAILTDSSPLAVLRARSYMHDVKQDELQTAAATILKAVHSAELGNLQIPPAIATALRAHGLSEPMIRQLQALKEAMANSEYVAKWIVIFEQLLTDCCSRQHNDTPFDVLEHFSKSVDQECKKKPPIDRPPVVSLHTPHAIPCADEQVDYIFYRAPYSSFSPEEHVHVADLLEKWFELDAQRPAEALPSTDQAMFREWYRILKPGKHLTILFEHRHEGDSAIEKAKEALRAAGFVCLENEKNDPHRRDWLVLATIPVTALSARKPS
jgi:hypothetical protein